MAVHREKTPKLLVFDASMYTIVGRSVKALDSSTVHSISTRKHLPFPLLCRSHSHVVTEPIVYNVIAGYCKPTSGTATIYGQDILTDRKSIDSTIGYCPHKDTLFDDLTVEENILFFSKVTFHWMTHINLYYYRSAVCKNLSSKICPHKSVLTNLSSKFDRFLPGRSQFDTNRRVNFSTPTSCHSATFV